MPGGFTRFSQIRSCWTAACAALQETSTKPQSVSIRGSAPESLIFRRTCTVPRTAQDCAARAADQGRGFTGAAVGALAERSGLHSRSHTPAAHSSSTEGTAGSNEATATQRMGRTLVEGVQLPGSAGATPGSEDATVSTKGAHLHAGSVRTAAPDECTGMPSQMAMPVQPSAALLPDCAGGFGTKEQVQGMPRPRR